MPLGTIQLIFVGPQNIYLTENPQITFFKTVYKRHTNFATDTIEEYFTGSIGFGQKVKCVLSKNGDLLSKLGMHIKLPNLNKHNTDADTSNKKCLANTKKLCSCQKCLLGDTEDKLVYGWANAIGHVLFDYIEIWIGEQLIDRQYGEWMEIWTELTQPAEKRLGYYEMIGKRDPIAFSPESFSGEMDLYIPFNFWFCRNIGLSLPVLALTHHEIEIIIQFRPFEQCWVTNKKDAPSPVMPSSIDGTIAAEYVYLCMEERHIFYKESHMYLIEQVQLNQNNWADNNTGRLNIELDFIHPVKELIWFVQRMDVLGPPDGLWEGSCNYPKGNDHFNFTTKNYPNLCPRSESFTSAKLQLNGVDRTQILSAGYFRLIQNYYHHTRVPTANNIYTYSFSLSPEDHQPTGECNMSMVDNARLCIKLLGSSGKAYRYPTRTKIYATNYNILLITGGMGATMFAN